MNKETKLGFVVTLIENGDESKLHCYFQDFEELFNLEISSMVCMDVFYAPIVSFRIQIVQCRNVLG